MARKAKKTSKKEIERQLELEHGKAAVGIEDDGRKSRVSTRQKQQAKAAAKRKKAARFRMVIIIGVVILLALGGGMVALVNS